MICAQIMIQEKKNCFPYYLCLRLQHTIMMGDDNCNQYHFVLWVTGKPTMRRLEFVDK